jgi:hypothetical protein
MEASIAAIASADKYAQAAGVEASSPSVLSWLATREQNWLMIFDGADGGYEEVEVFIPAVKHGNLSEAEELRAQVVGLQGDSDASS